MEKIDFKATLRKYFELRPDDAYSFEEVETQFRQWRAEAFRYHRGEICVKAGTPATEFAAVVSGVLHSMIPSEIGDDLLMRAIRPGEMAGVEQVYMQEQLHPCDVVAAAETEVFVFKVAEVRRWRTDPKSLPLFDFISVTLIRALRDARMKAMILSGHDIEERLRRYLTIRIHRERTRTLVMPGTAGEFANYLGVNQCALSRTLSRLRAEGKIEYRRNVITVLDARVTAGVKSN